MKSVVIKPVTGFMDLRSEPEDVPVGGYRYVQNFSVAQKNKLCRSFGWSRFMDRDVGFNNQDFHDQLISITGQSRQPITFLFEAESTLKQTMLLLGTDSALFALNVGTGNYRVLSSAIGGFTQATQNRDTIVLTNDNDRPRYWVFDGPAIEEAPDSLALIPDLESLGITQVGVVITYRGVTFYMNVVEHGRAFANRIMWSDLDNAISLIPGEESVAGDLDLDSGEAILACKPLGNILLIYTTRGIWQLSASGGEDGFSASKRYDPEKTGEACLAFKKTLVSAGDTHVYMGASGIYEYSIFDPKPKQVEWVHRASSVIFDDINREDCLDPVAFFNSDRHEIWISWVASGSTLPSRTLCLNTQFPFSSIIDHGFTAFCQFMPREPVIVLRDWILDNCVCTEAQLMEFFGAITNEGGYCEARDVVACDSQPDSFFTTVPQTLVDDIVMEDWNQTTATANSLCARMVDADGNPLSLADLCLSETIADECNAARLFVMASAEDYCLKQPNLSYYREMATSFTGCGEYALRGYRSILRSGPLAFKDVDNEKRISNFTVEASVMASTVPAQLAMRIGSSMQALDPNLECGIIWQTQVPLALECQSLSVADHLARHTRPDGRFEWPMFWLGTNLYFELTVVNTHSNPVDTGGAVCFSKFVMEITPSAVRY